jgi:hypothetical protein
MRIDVQSSSMKKTEAIGLSIGVKPVSGSQSMPWPLPQSGMVNNLA